MRAAKCAVTEPDGSVREHSYGPRWLSIAALDPFQRAITPFHRLSFIAWTLERLGLDVGSDNQPKDPT